MYAHTHTHSAHAACSHYSVTYDILNKLTTTTSAIYMQRPLLMYHAHTHNYLNETHSGKHALVQVLWNSIQILEHH